MITLQEAVQHTGKAVLDYLDHSAEVPVVDTAAAQGDVMVLRVTKAASTDPMPKMVVAVASEASSNTHTIHPSGECFYTAHTANGPADVVLGTMTIPEGSTAVLIHQEHGALEILPGTYEVRRQREWANEWAYVQD